MRDVLAAGDGGGRERLDSARLDVAHRPLALLLSLGGLLGLAAVVAARRLLSAFRNLESLVRKGLTAVVADAAVGGAHLYSPCGSAHCSATNERGRAQDLAHARPHPTRAVPPISTPRPSSPGSGRRSSRWWRARTPEAGSCSGRRRSRQWRTGRTQRRQKPTWRSS